MNNEDDPIIESHARQLGEVCVWGGASETPQRRSGSAGKDIGPELQGEKEVQDTSISCISDRQEVQHGVALLAC